MDISKRGGTILDDDYFSDDEERNMWLNPDIFYTKNGVIDTREEFQEVITPGYQVVDKIFNVLKSFSENKEIFKYLTKTKTSLFLDFILDKKVSN